MAVVRVGAVCTVLMLVTISDASDSAPTSFDDLISNFISSNVTTLATLHNMMTDTTTAYLDSHRLCLESLVVGRYGIAAGHHNRDHVERLAAELIPQLFASLHMYTLDRIQPDLVVRAAVKKFVDQLYGQMILAVRAADQYSLGNAALDDEYMICAVAEMHMLVPFNKLVDDIVGLLMPGLRQLRFVVNAVSLARQTLIQLGELMPAGEFCSKILTDKEECSKPMASCLAYAIIWRESWWRLRAAVLASHQTMPASTLSQAFNETASVVGDQIEKFSHSVGDIGARLAETCGSSFVGRRTEPREVRPHRSRPIFSQSRGCDESVKMTAKAAKAIESVADWAVDPSANMQRIFDLACPTADWMSIHCVVIRSRERSDQTLNQMIYDVSELRATVENPNSFHY